MVQESAIGGPVTQTGYDFIYRDMHAGYMHRCVDSDTRLHPSFFLLQRQTQPSVSRVKVSCLVFKSTI